jgi:queuine/archaeosine tRNA-ribosyltransferase
MFELTATDPSSNARWDGPILTDSDGYQIFSLAARG